MSLSRRQLLHLATASTLAFKRPSAAHAQGYPTRFVRLVVGTPPGTSPDTIARLFWQWLSERLGQPFVVENRPGAGTNIATETVVRAPAGRLHASALQPSNAINATLYQKLNFNFCATSRRSPSSATSFLMAVTPSFPVKTVVSSSLMPRPIPARSTWLPAATAARLMCSANCSSRWLEVDLVHVPYRSSFYPDLFSGRVQVAFIAVAGSLALVKAGKIRALR